MTFNVESCVLITTCTDCGAKKGIPFADLRWAPPSAIEAFSAHACDAPTAPAPAVVTPRPTPDAAGRERVRAFLAKTVEYDAGAFVLFSDLLEAYEEKTGDYAGAGRFSKRLRAVLPPGTAIRREMIDGVRARRVIGVRWR